MKSLLKGENRIKLLSAAAIVFGGIFLFELLEHFAFVLSAIRACLRAAAPVLYGLCLAFILNLPMSFVESRVFGRLKDKKPRLVRAVSITVTYVLFLGIIAVMLCLIVPKAIDSVAALIGNLGGYIDEAAELLDGLSRELKLSPEAYELIGSVGKSAVGMANEFAAGIVPGLLKYTAFTVYLAYSLLITFVVSVHSLIKKERLKSFFKSTVRALFKKPRADAIIKRCAYISRVFRRYISGQLASCLILGCLCCIGMRILNMPYPELISVYIFVMAFIPIIGPWVSTLSSAFIILMTRIDEPWLALWFIILIAAIQQLDDNLIAPRLIGDAVGIPGILVLIAVVVAGGLFGVFGLLLAVPAAAVMYRIYAEWMEGRKKRQDARGSRKT